MTESIFSMDGDAADLHGIAKLKQSHRFMLILDEAHRVARFRVRHVDLAVHGVDDHVEEHGSDAVEDCAGLCDRRVRCR